MTLWQKVRRSQYEFEIKFFGSIILLAVGAFLFYLINKLFDKIPDVESFFNNNAHYLFFFVCAFLAVCLISYIVYKRTLDFVDAETKISIKAINFLIFLWVVFWLAWSIFCAWLTFKQAPSTMLVKIIIVTLAVVPGLTSFVLSNKFRQQDILFEEESKKRMGDNYYKTEVYTIYLDKKYYVGFYGLLCLPVYLITIFIEHLLN